MLNYKCHKCLVLKDKSNFYPNKKAKNGLFTYCINCSKESSRKWKIDNKERNSKNNKIWRLNNQELQKRLTKEWLIKNKEHSNNYFKLYFRKRAKDPKFRLNRNMSTAMYLSLKGNKGGRGWESLVGYSLKDLLNHLESKFEPWMNFDNYGLWEVDHILPKSSFNFTKPEDEGFKECWKYDST